MNQRTAGKKLFVRIGIAKNRKRAITALIQVV
jgi:hypothetical protein